MKDCCFSSQPYSQSVISIVVASVIIVNQDSVVTIAACYRVDSLGIDSRWGRGFPHLFRLSLRPTQPPVEWLLDHSLVVNWPGHGVNGVNHSSLSSTRFKKVELYLYSHSVPPWQVIG